jgi:hypothetical protein
VIVLIILVFITLLLFFLFWFSVSLVYILRTWVHHLVLMNFGYLLKKGFFR